LGLGEKKGTHRKKGSNGGREEKGVFTRQRKEKGNHAETRDDIGGGKFVTQEKGGGYAGREQGSRAWEQRRSVSVIVFKLLIKSKQSVGGGVSIRPNN